LGKQRTVQRELKGSSYPNKDSTDGIEDLKKAAEAE
jgi:hypothetical protein